MYSASLCDYDAGKLRTYRHLNMHTYRRDDGSFYAERDSYTLYAEDYEYDEPGLMRKAVWGDKFVHKKETSPGKFELSDYTRESPYRFFHNEDGFLYAYKPLEPRPDGLDPMYYVAKSKLRKI